MKEILKRHKFLWFITLILGLILTLSNVGVAYIIGTIIDTITRGGIADLKITGIYTAILLSLLVVFGLLYSYFSAKFCETVLRDTKSQMMRRILGAPIYDFQEQNVSYYYNMLTQDLEQIHENYIKLTYDTLVSLGGLIISLGALFYINIKMSLIFLGITFLVTLVPRIFVGLQTKASSNFSSKYEGYVGELENVLSGFESIKLLDVTYALYNRLMARDSNMEESRKKKRVADGIATYSITGISFLSQIGCMIVGAVFVMRGEITTGMLLAAVQILNFVFSPIGTISQNINLMKANKVIRDKIEPFLVDEEETGLEITEGEIKLEDYGIQFGKNEILRDFNFTFEPNKSYAIIGASGSGKSVLAKSLAGYYDDYSGDILYDKVEGKDLKPSSINQVIRYIGADRFVMNDNIKENIRMYRDIPDSEVERVAKLVGFDKSFIEKEELGHDGKFVSSGEYQRISIARALLDNPYCLIVDEPTANLDPQNVKEISKLISEIDVPIKIIITHHFDDEYLDSFDEVIDFNKMKAS